MSTSELRRPRLLRAIDAPFGSYYRVGRDFKRLQALLADRCGFSGLVFDAAADQRQGDPARQEPSLETARHRREGWRGPLDAINQQGPPASFAAVPDAKRLDSRLRRNA